MRQIKENSEQEIVSDCILIAIQKWWKVQSYSNPIKTSVSALALGTFHGTCLSIKACWSEMKPGRQQVIPRHSYDMFLLVYSLLLTVNELPLLPNVRLRLKFSFDWVWGGKFALIINSDSDQTHLLSIFPFLLHMKYIAFLLRSKARHFSGSALATVLVEKRAKMNSVWNIKA